LMGFFIDCAGTSTKEKKGFYVISSSSFKNLRDVSCLMSYDRFVMFCTVADGNDFGCLMYLAK
jgi:hypothetical protein